ncbi:MAG: mechanosensitive ion channel family protein [Anaeromyxobacteraceae bacterium]
MSHPSGTGGGVPAIRIAPRPGRPLRLALLACAVVAATPTRADLPPRPLQPADRSSPRATLKRFLESADGLMQFMGDVYVKDQTREGFEHLLGLGTDVVRCLDLQQVAPAARMKTGRAAAIALYATLSRIPLPPLDQVPDAEQMAARKDAASRRWTIPDTEITFIRVDGGPEAGDFLFSPETVARAAEFEQRTRGLPPLRPVAATGLGELAAEGGGWWVPYGWIQALPSWLRARLGGQATWKWFAIAVLAIAYALVLAFAFRRSRTVEGHGPLARALRRLLAPIAVIVATPVFAWIALVQVNLVGQLAVAIGIAANAVVFLAGAGVSIRLAPVVAEALVSSPRIAAESIDAHLIRLTARVLGFGGALVLLAIGANQLGIPVYGIVAGVSVGGLAVALAAQPTLENLIAGLNLFADKPVRIGDRCKVGESNGTVLAIGIRSTRIRNADRTVTTVPNSVLARTSIVNLSDRDRTPFKATVGLRCESTQAQVREVLAGLNALLAAHPRVEASGAKARLAALGASSLDVEVSAEVLTSSSAEFQDVREELLLGVLDVVERCGTGLAFPSQTLYLGKDRPPRGPAA